MKTHIAQIIGAVLILLSGASGDALAEDTFNVKVVKPKVDPTSRQIPGEEEPPEVESPTPARITLCTAMDIRTCKSAALPIQTGNVQHIIRGNWVAPGAASGSWIAFTNQHATLCYMHSVTTALDCVPIAAYVPADTNVEFRDMGSGLKAIVFTQRPGAAQPLADYYQAVRTFTHALDEAAKVAQTHASLTYTSDIMARAGGGDRALTVRADRPAPTIMEICSYCERSDGGYAGGSWDTWDFTTDFWEYDSGLWEPASNFQADGWDFPRVVIQGARPGSEPAFFPPFDWIFPDLIRVGRDLPPQPDWPETVTYSNTTTCVFSGFVVVCTAPRPSPVPVEPSLTPQRPWNPALPTWNFCKTFGIMCSTDDHDRGDFASHDGKTYEELVEACLKQLEIEVAACYAQKSVGADWRTVHACNERAAARSRDCQTTAREKKKAGLVN